MPEHLSSPTTLRPDPIELIDDHNDSLRLLSRSPHPYHRHNSELLEPLDRFVSDSISHRLDGAAAAAAQPRSRTSFPAISRDTTPTSDSGTEADDEHFLKGLPAPRAKLHKGLRGRNEVLSGTSTPLPSPAPFEEEGIRISRAALALKKEPRLGKELRPDQDHSKRIRVVIRRLAEFLLLGILGALVQANNQARPVLYRWRIELYTSLGLAGVLAALYPLRLLIWGYRHPSSSRRIPVYVPLSFDPAPLLYPPTITLLVSALISTGNEAVLLPNIILALCALPPSLFPALQGGEVCNPLHWLVACAPLLARAKLSDQGPAIDVGSHASLGPEVLALLYPLHQYLCVTLHALTTTSLLTAELQLLSVALLNVLLTSTSPQMVIIKAMLWVGGLDILVLCTRVIIWGISLARVPKWRFRRVGGTGTRSSFFSTLTAWRRVRHDLFHTSAESSCGSCEAMDDSEDSDGMGGPSANGLARVQTATLDGADSSGFDGVWSSQKTHGHDVHFNLTDQKPTSLSQRRHTLPTLDKPRSKSRAHTHSYTPSGRRKRSASSSVRAFFSLTQSEATTRKWLYALYVYVCIVGVVFAPLPTVGVKDFVQRHALHGYEPVGWALGYLFGDLPWFRWQVISNNLERWVLLPTRIVEEDLPALGWVEYFRQAVFGEANTRLMLSAYYVVVIGCGLIVVFRLSPFYEVDTRRKVFHFMMVAMFAPSIYIDPTFIALALSIVLAAFLLLDLLRASQLPPLSKPIAFFLAPYVDGRDLRGPVVISHIFLLIGCAIPLWLSLGALRRTGSGYLEGWEVPTRDVSMVAGVICVGLGDAAASLIGRRWGHRKWLWGGGKSLEGSVAFATAVFIGLMAAHLWLRIGGWPQSATSANNFPLSSLDYPLPAAAAKSGICASMASLTEAVLTGGNDNVIVPVVLWTCVKSLGI